VLLPQPVDSGRRRIDRQSNTPNKRWSAPDPPVSVAKLLRIQATPVAKRTCQVVQQQRAFNFFCWITGSDFHFEKCAPQSKVSQLCIWIRIPAEFGLRTSEKPLNRELNIAVLLGNHLQLPLKLSILPQSPHKLCVELFSCRFLESLFTFFFESDYFLLNNVKKFLFNLQQFLSYGTKKVGRWHLLSFFNLPNISVIPTVLSRKTTTKPTLPIAESKICSLPSPCWITFKSILPVCLLLPLHRSYCVSVAVGCRLLAICSDAVADCMTCMIKWKTSFHQRESIPYILVSCAKRLYVMVDTQLDPLESYPPQLVVPT